MNPWYHFASWMTIFSLAISGATLVAVSGCRSFCNDNGLFIAGFVLLMIMALVVMQWIMIAAYNCDDCMK